jgi:kynurenine aminotransferase
MIPSRSTLLSSLAQFKLSKVSLSPSLPRLSAFGARPMSATAARPDPFRPAARVAGQRQDVWYGVSLKGYMGSTKLTSQVHCQ